MTTQPRVEGLAGMFGRDDLALGFAKLYGTIWSHGVLDHQTKEVVRMRNARVTDCGL